MEKYLKTLEEIETRIIEIIDKVICKVHYLVITAERRVNIGVIINPDIAYEYKEELYKLAIKYRNSIPLDDPRFLCGDQRYKAKLDVIFFFLESRKEDPREIDLDDPNWWWDLMDQFHSDN